MNGSRAQKKVLWSSSIVVVDYSYGAKVLQ